RRHRRLQVRQRRARSRRGARAAARSAGSRLSRGANGLAPMPLGEFELIARFFDRGPAREAVLGIGDDCALLAPPAPHNVTAGSTDMLRAGRHFLAGDAPASVGHNPLAATLSDLAAMGARPRAFTLALALPQVDETWLA